MSNPRIIAGKARGFRLQPVPGGITRPITDRVKEALFNILGADINGAAFLDLFGGTGSVGIEALSRGAAFTRFIDVHRLAVQTIQSNLERTRLSNFGEVLLADSFSFLRGTPNRKFDYIYIAPPQYKEMWQKALVLVDQNPGWMFDNSWVIVQIDPLEYQEIPLSHLQQFDQRRYGSTLLVFYETVSQEEGQESSTTS